MRLAAIVLQPREGRLSHNGSHQASQDENHFRSLRTIEMLLDSLVEHAQTRGILFLEGILRTRLIIYFHTEFHIKIEIR